jgi:hypothetical protein
MNNFEDGCGLSLLNSFNENILTEDNNNIIPFLLDESEIPTIKEYQKNIFVTKKETIKEKIKHQKLLLEQKRGLTEKEKNEIYFNKKEDLKRRNREAAQKSRDKKKIELMKIIEENKQLKYEIYLINSKINLLCSGCRSIFELNMENAKDNNICVNCSSIKENADNNIDINDIPSTNYSFGNLKTQKLFNFTLLGLFSLLCIFGLFSLNTSNNIFFDNKDINKQKIRNIEEIEKNNGNGGNISINNNISKLNDYYIFQKNNDTNLNIDKYNKYNKYNNYNNNNHHHHNYKNEICEKDYFTSFQCQKKSFIHNINTYNNENTSNNDNNDYLNNSFFEDNKNSINKNKNSIYFKLFVQSCSKDEGDINQNDTINDNPHYIFSSDNNMCQDFYYFCQRIEN